MRVFLNPNECSIFITILSFTFLLFVDYHQEFTLDRFYKKGVYLCKIGMGYRGFLFEPPPRSLRIKLFKGVLKDSIWIPFKGLSSSYPPLLYRISCTEEKPHFEHGRNSTDKSKRMTLRIQESLRPTTKSPYLPVS